jgi:Ca2+-binding RTX toxin-like protein
LYGADRPAGHGVVSGGTGRDLVQVASGGIRLLRVVQADLRSRTLNITTDADSDSIELGLPGFEDVTAEARSLRFVGDHGPNRLTWTGCRVRVHAGGGNDTVLWSEAGDQDGCPRAAHHDLITGNGGSDHLVGSRYDDVLVGGPGRDHANGKHGRDRCSAEVVRKCEVNFP